MIAHRVRRVAAGSIAMLTLGMAVVIPSAQGPANSSPELVEGQKLFDRTCAPCHGIGGKGGGGYSKPLLGARSVGELSKYLSTSMPPGDPVKPAQAAKIAAYMHDAFYSPVAQERNRPARISLQRLTAKQYRNAVSDLVDGFQPTVTPGDGTGLKGTYYKGRPNNNNRGFDRTDGVVNFDFEDKAPAPDFDAYNFSMVWEGSLVAPDTGDYELIIQSDQAVRMWFNGSKQPLIDGWVKSGNDTEFKATAQLVAGRAYPLRLEFSKATQGVNNDEQRKKTPPGKAFVRFLWSPPKRPAELVPARVLVPQGRRPSYVVSVPFPPDDRSMGYERGSDISKEWSDATTHAALDAAAYIEDNLQMVTGVDPQAGDRGQKLRSYAERFVTRAFRQPLDAEMKKMYVDRQFEGVEDPVVALKRSVILTLKSPRFLFREPGADPKNPYTTASRLSFALWDTIPDDALLQAAASGELKKPEVVRNHAERLANDPRAWTKLRDFLMLWMKVDDIPTLVKNPKSYPAFDAAVSADLRTSFELFLKNAVWTPESDFKQLFLSNTQYLNPRLARLYGAKVSTTSDAVFEPVVTDGGKRFGVVTNPYVLSRMAYLDATSPIHRGVLIAKNWLGRTLNPPPVAVAPAAAGLHPNLTTRERVAMQTKPDACASCHTLINPLGFTLEGYDAIGRIRSADAGKKIDASGYYRTRSGNVVRMNGAGDLARFLASNEETQSAFLEKLFHHLVKQPVRAYGPNRLETFRKQFVTNGTNVRRFMVDAAVTTAMWSGANPNQG